jgi:hypothetical protein
MRRSMMSDREHARVVAALVDLADDLVKTRMILRQMLSNLPAMWGDDVHGGQVAIIVNADFVEDALALLEE